MPPRASLDMKFISISLNVTSSPSICIGERITKFPEPFPSIVIPAGNFIGFKSISDPVPLVIVITPFTMISSTPLAKAFSNSTEVETVTESPSANSSRNNLFNSSLLSISSSLLIPVSSSVLVSSSASLPVH